VNTLNTLSKKDRRLLSRLEIPQAQKLLFENYWSANPGKSLKWYAVFCFYLIDPALLAAFASPYFISGTKPIINISIVLLWLVKCVGTILGAFITLVFVLQTHEEKDEVFDRVHAHYLPGGRTLLYRMYSAILSIGIFALTASEGYFITSGMVAICWCLIWFFNKAKAQAVKNFLEERVAETPQGRVMQVITGRQ
jgi:hypothetical protein